MSDIDDRQREIRVRDLFLEACDLDDPEQLEQFLDQACADDRQARQEVESLLSAEKESNTLFNKNFVEEFEESLGSLVGSKVGRYQVLEKLGEGGFGEVYRVEQLDPIRRKLALKIIKPGMDSREIIRRFESERQALALLDHQNICHIVDAGATEPGRPYFVMELASGQPITRYCDEHGLSIDERLNLFKQVCSGVEHAHKNGILHRDLNPSNIIIVEHDGQAIPKIIDFGIAKSIQGHLTGKTILTRREVFVGTPDYMSPEQFTLSSDDLDHRTDLYSLGCILYELVCGTTPFGKGRLKQAGLSEISRVLIEEDPEKPSTHIQKTQDTEELAENRDCTSAKLERKLRGDLDGIILKCLEKDRHRRYASVEELQQDLDAFLESRPVKASSPGIFTRSMKMLRRSRQSLSGWVAAFVLLIGLTVVLGTSFFSNSTSGEYEKSIGVLPFEDHGENVENRYFSDGIHEGLLVQISRIPGMRVIAETSVREYRDTGKNLKTIAEELGVSLLLKGGIRWAADSVQLNVQLLDPEDNTTIWADTYIRKLSPENVFEIEQEISTEVANALGVVLSSDATKPEERFPTTSIQALEAYYRGLECRKNVATNSTQEAIAHFKNAISLDENFAQAHTALASALMNLKLRSGVSLLDVLEEVDYHIARAMELDDASSPTHVALATLRILQRQYEEAGIAIEKAIQLDPSNSDAYTTKAMLLSLGPGGFPNYELGPRERIHLYEKALELDPNNANAMNWRVRILTAEGRHEEALELRKSIVATKPNDVLALYDLSVLLTRDAQKERNFIEAVVVLRKAHSIDPYYIPVLNSLYMKHMVLGDYEAGRFWLDRYLSVQQERLSWLWRKADKEHHFGTAEDRLKTALLGLQESPRHTELLRHATEVDIMNGQADLARHRWKSAYPELFERDAKVDLNVIYETECVARILLLTGETEQAQHLIDGCWKVLDKSLPNEYRTLKSVLHVLEGDYDLALEKLRSLVEENYPPHHLRFYTEFAVLQDNPEFQSIVAEGERRMAEQLQQIHELEADGELAPIPDMPGK